MPRAARVVLPSYPHHIVQRGHNRQPAFLSDEDYLYFLENLKEWKRGQLTGSDSFVGEVFQTIGGRIEF